MKNTLIIPPQKPLSNSKSRVPEKHTQLFLSISTNEKKAPKSGLQITSVPVAERLNPKENRYILLIQPQGIRAAAGQYTATEAHEIARLTRGWDWSLDANNQPQCLPALEALLTSIVKQSSQGGEKA